MADDSTSMQETAMPQIVQFSAPGVVELVPCPSEVLAPGHARVRSWYSGISAGTELTAYWGTNPYLTKTGDAECRLSSEGPPTSSYHIAGTPDFLG